MKYQSKDKKTCILAVSIVLLLVGVTVNAGTTVRGNTSVERAPIDRDSTNKIMANDTWVNMNPSVKPSPRNNHGFIYDSLIDRFVLVGGFDDVTKFNDTWLYDYNNNTWVKLFPVKKPPALTSVSMAYDELSDHIVLFGGYDGTKYINETWSYNYTSNNWTNMKPVNAPSARYGHAMEYDSNHDQIILFGGSDGTKNLNDTWAYDYDNNNWTNISPVIGPSPRRASMITYDSQSDLMILFGGCVSIASSQYFNETWTFDYDNKLWTNVTTSTRPSARIGPGITYDVKGDQVVLFGGYGKSGGNDETWTYDLGGKLWTKMNPSTKPSLRWGNPMAYDDKKDIVAFFGGYDFSVKGDTWVYIMEKYPSVVSTDPVNGSTNIPPNTNISITFNQAMNVSYTQTAISSSPAITGTYSWNPDKTTIKWNPDKYLNFSTKYTITIATSAKSKLGINLPNAYVFSFNTSSPPLDIYPPYVVSTSPTNGSINISLNSSITVQWNETMNQTSADSAFSSLPFIPCVMSWSNVNMTCTPTTNLQSSTNYTITITTAAKDLAGNAMLLPYTFSFKTANAGGPNHPIIKRTSPADKSKNVSANVMIIIYFSEVMNRSATESAFSSVPFYACTFSWGLSDMFLYITPNSILQSNTLYTITISTNAKSLAGFNMEKAYSFSFTISSYGLISPIVNSTIPSNGSSNVPLNTSIALTFSEVMNKSATQTAISASPPIIGTFSWDTPAKVVTLDPISDLQSSTKYTITISTGAKSQVGVSMQNAYTFSFTTMTPPDTTPPTVISTNPTNNQTDVDKNSKIMIVFSEPMNIASTAGAVSISPGSITEKIWDNSNKTLTLIANLEDGKLYTVTIATDARDVAGNAMVSTYTFSFTTRSSSTIGGISILILSVLALIVIIAVLSVLALLLLRKKKERCPECNEPIPQHANLCPGCGYDFIRKTKRSIAEKEKSEESQPEPAMAKEKTAVEINEEPAASRNKAIENIKKRKERARK